ncbi:MAG: hypothetical protein A3E36_01235 [Candidatus Andersenbacteria bacterium RIFCSPHIGHO2_12_FULL_45_11b]|uniref:PDZ domain-containing protein n=1 Tax=Candidatus Andersenbacteria bacterium RIFCSPHIGHO2_12_FULL_45_11b TaxID=1797282 RepID=A0A1G1XBJ5_9BACT|nr:MAG: hypothetical protein A3E36_01235 [Candidatus Andersenbacteria bacterium RIFCSPHIGHO2_12_FULL_45_11b]
MKTESTTIKISLGSLLVFIILLGGVGALGGYIGTRMVTPKQVATNSSSEQTKTIVPVTQQITISPGKLATDVIANKSKSIFLLAHKTSSKELQPFAIGVVLTNDGVIASTQPGGSSPVVAVGEDGAQVTLTGIGTDTLTGLHFFRLDHKVVTPIDVAQLAPRIGASLLGVFRSSTTMAPSTQFTHLSGITPPNEDSAPGIQQIGVLQRVQPVLLPGTALLDDDGRLAGLLQDSEHASLLLSPDIQQALGRLSANNLSQNPLADFGLAITWTLQENDQSVFAVRAIAQSITPKTVAGQAGIKNGDIITAINGNTITWDSSILRLLGGNQIQLSVMRNGELHTIPISKQAS